MYPLPDSFAPGTPVSGIPRQAFETVFRILNYLTVTNGTIRRTADPSAATPWVIDIEGAGAGGNELPSTEGHAGDVLTVANDLTLAWSDAPNSLPAATAADVGKFLVVTVSGSTVSFSWGKAFPVNPVGGDIIYYNSTSGKWESIGKPDTNNHVLTWSTSSAKPQWQPLSAVNTQLPSTSGKSQYQVLQLDGSLAPVWDWVRST